MAIFNSDKLGLGLLKLFAVLFLALAIVIIVLLAF